mmetsp:Transcript_8458/g.17636  ORF Transcript_8458/g.17636 Transcript_8458/m.17636 type:complete len:137 (-) Transcript_8458:1202-1612(-)
MDESIHVRLIANYHVIRMESLPEFTGDDKCSSVASASRYSLTNRMEYKRTTKAGTKINNPNKIRSIMVIARLIQQRILSFYWNQAFAQCSTRGKLENSLSLTARADGLTMPQARMLHNSCLMQSFQSPLVGVHQLD